MVVFGRQAPNGNNPVPSGSGIFGTGLKFSDTASEKQLTFEAANDQNSLINFSRVSGATVKLEAGSDFSNLGTVGDNHKFTLQSGATDVLTILKNGSTQSVTAEKDLCFGSLYQDATELKFPWTEDVSSPTNVVQYRTGDSVSIGKSSADTGITLDISGKVLIQGNAHITNTHTEGSPATTFQNYLNCPDPKKDCKFRLMGQGRATETQLVNSAGECTGTTTFKNYDGTNFGSTNTIKISRSKVAARWEASQVACPAGWWVCSAAERLSGPASCGTANIQDTFYLTSTSYTDPSFATTQRRGKIWEDATAVDGSGFPTLVYTKANNSSYSWVADGGALKTNADMSANGDILTATVTGTATAQAFMGKVINNAGTTKFTSVSSQRSVWCCALSTN